MMLRFLFIGLLIISAPSFAQEQDNAAIAATDCAELKNPLNKAKFEAIDIKSFADWYLSGLEKKYPKKDIATFKHQVLTYKPIEGKADDANPFVFISAMACFDRRGVREGIYGENLEQSLIWVLDERAKYFEKNKARGK